MQLNELLGQRVTDGTGDDIGRVADVRLVQDGPLLASMNRALRIDGLIIVQRRATRLLGYERHVGPALLRWLIHRRLGNVWYLPWHEIDRIADGRVTIRPSRSTLTSLEDMPRR
jgi:sporulation protein YlmC with PRC-barrel domain